jgi:hypothetical protein
MSNFPRSILTFFFKVMYREKYGFTEPPKQLQDAFARVGIQYTVLLDRSIALLCHPHFAVFEAQSKTRPALLLLFVICSLLTA